MEVGEVVERSLKGDREVSAAEGARRRCWLAHNPFLRSETVCRFLETAAPFVSSNLFLLP